MILQRHITLTVLFVFCLPLALSAAPPQYEDVTYGFLGTPLPPEIMLFEGVIDHIPEKGNVISINDTLYTLMTSTLYLTTSKSRTSPDYFQPGTSVKFYAHVQDKTVYEIMATSAPVQTGTSQDESSTKPDSILLEDGVWRN